MSITQITEQEQRLTNTLRQTTEALTLVTAERDALRDAAQAGLDALDCDGESHRCGRCDEYVDRNGVAREQLQAAMKGKS